MFRIAFGKMDFSESKKCDDLTRSMKKIGRKEIAFIQRIKLSDIKEHEIVQERTINYNNKPIFIKTYQENINDFGILIVIQIQISTLKFPNYFSLTFIGKIFSEGVIFLKDGQIRKASDDFLWNYR